MSGVRGGAGDRRPWSVEFDSHGRSVHRPDHPAREFERALLDHLHDRGWRGAPRQYGHDHRGRLVYDFLPGRAVHHRAPLPRHYIARAARLTREFHDLTAGTALAGDQEVVCHNDLDPRNTIDLDGVPYAFVDWELAAPGRRVHDVAHLCWQFARLGPGAVGAGARIRLVCDSYGLAERGDVVETVLWWQDRCRRGILDLAAKGDPKMRHFRDRGVVEEVREAREWTAGHRAELEAALASDASPPHPPGDPAAW
ncbi:phosphotransferase [Nocardiopsis sp. NPDC006198]|uniref:phosphotransferase n=1 Tax=Nocardiopsis sp. NPDC006198 TaxID=3154472 RepID=UPI0033ADF7BC